MALLENFKKTSKKIFDVIKSENWRINCILFFISQILAVRQAREIDLPLQFKFVSDQCDPLQTMSRLPLLATNPGMHEYRV